MTLLNFITAERAIELLEYEEYSDLSVTETTTQFFYFKAIDPFGLAVELRVEREPEEMGPDHFNEEYYHNVSDRRSLSLIDWEWTTVIASDYMPLEGDGFCDINSFITAE